MQEAITFMLERPNKAELGYNKLAFEVPVLSQKKLSLIKYQFLAHLNFRCLGKDGMST